MEHKPTTRDILIIKLYNSSAPIKVEVLEVTGTTYRFANMDVVERDIYPIKDLGEGFIVNSESVSEKQKSIEETMLTFNKQPLVSWVEPNYIKFRMEISEFENSYKVLEVVDTLELKQKRTMEMIEMMNK